MTEKRRLTNKIRGESEAARALLAGLNEAQRQAVTHGTGPLLVVAGAGTGKTSVLTSRAAWLVMEGHAKPSEVLALTFTDKAAGEMEHRTDLLLPLGQADLWVHTFHSFGRRILEEEALVAGLPPDFSVLSEGEQHVFLGDRLQTLNDLEHYRPLGNPYRYVEPIVKLISRAKDELVSPTEYTRFAEAKLTAATTDVERNEAARQEELARIYTAYEQWKREAGVVDYGDLIVRLIELAKGYPNVRERLSNRFKYVLVDEFQDTNIAQYELTKLLLRDEQNLTVVGDDDQAIYKFRGAAVSNILGFLDDFPAAKQVVLADNYRSGQLILDAAYRLIQHNNPDRLEARLKIDKHLISHLDQVQPPRDHPRGGLPSHPAGGGEAIITPQTELAFEFFRNDRDEARRVVEIVRDRRAAGVALKQIAVLARSNSQLEELEGYFAVANVPARTLTDRSFALRPEIRGVIAFLRVLTEPTRSVDLIKLAMSPYYQADPEWLLVFNDAVRARKQSLHEVLQDDSRPPWQLLPEEGRVMMLRIRDELSGYRHRIASHTVSEILYEFLKDHGALQMGTIEDETRIANLSVLFHAIKAYSRAGRDPHALSFVEHLDQLIHSLKSPALDLGPEQSAVNLLTVHAAKGLEFDTIILPSLISGRFPSTARRDVLALPDQLVKETLPQGDEHLEEERRLFYVAMTRAKRALYLTAASGYGAGVRARKPSPFVSEALGLTVLPEPQMLERAQQSALFEFAPISREGKPLRYPEANGMLMLSPAKIESYLRCPAEFYWRSVLQAPATPSAVLVYGNAVHAGIEVFHRLHKQGEVNLDALVAAAHEQFHASWQDEGFVSREQARQMLVRGEETLTRFAALNLDVPSPTLVEHWIHVTLASHALSEWSESNGLRPKADIEIRGRIDALWLGSEIEIRDYKTSEGVKDEKSALRKAKENLPLRIYGYAVRREAGRAPNRLTLDFVESNVLGIVEPTDTQLDEVEAIIADVATNIRAGKFDPTPGQHICDVCGTI